MAKHLKKIILFLITLVFLYFVFVNININEFIITIKVFDTGFIFPLIISCIISLSFIALYFKQLISKSVPNPSLLTLIHLCLTSAALNIFLPARAGDIFRAFYTGSVYKTDKVKIFGTVMLERIFDVVIILPPYTSDAAENALNFLKSATLKNKESVIVWEHDKTKLEMEILGFEKINQKRYGTKYLTILKLQG